MIVEVGREGERKRVEVRPFESEWFPGVLDLYRHIFGSRSTGQFERRWRWQYEANPSCEALPSYLQVALHEGRVVGHMGAYPMPLRYAGEVRQAQCGADLMVHPDYKGLGTRLVKRYAAQTPGVGCGVHPAAQSIVSQFGGRPWGTSRTRFFYRLGDGGAWCRVIRRYLPDALAGAVSPAWTRWIPFRAPARAANERLEGPPLRVRRLPRRSAGADLRDLPAFDAAYDELWNRFSADLEFTIEKTAAYMNWRYVDCPTMSPFRSGLYEGGRLVAVLVGVDYPLTDKARRRAGAEGEILELIFADASEQGLEDLVAAGIHRLNEASVDTVNTTGLHPRAYPLLERMGFERRASDRFANILIFSDEDWEFVERYSEGDWYLTAGDGDALN